MPNARLANFSKRLRRAMGGAGMAPRDLARAADVAEATVYRHLSGDRDEPRAETITAYARALGVSADELLGIEPRRTLPGGLEVGVGPLVKLRVLSRPADARGESSATMLVPEIILPGDMPQDALAIAPIHDDALAPDLDDGDLAVVAIDHDWADSDLIAVALDDATVAIRRGYRNERDVLGVTGDPRLTRHLPPDAVIGRVMRIIHSV